MIGLGLGCSGSRGAKAVLMSSLMLLTACAWGNPRAEGTLKAGDTAPAFSLPGSDGRTYTLEQFAGRRTVVLAWFPKAFTGG